VPWKSEVKQLVASGRRGLREAEGDEVGEELGGAGEEVEALGLSVKFNLGGGGWSVRRGGKKRKSIGWNERYLDG
jgi:hypothetical protein